MTDITVAIESPVSPESEKLIEGSEAALREHYTPDECFSFSPEELLDDRVSFYVARKEGAAVGCIALVNEGAYGEVKRLYVPHSARGLGIAKILVNHLEDSARSMGLSWVKLETGEELAAAVALYKSYGYSVCGTFGDYEDHPASLFMEKAL
jgi:putative acetyltransferase